MAFCRCPEALNAVTLTIAVQALLQRSKTRACAKPAISVFLASKAENVGRTHAGPHRATMVVRRRIQVKNVGTEPKGHARIAGPAYDRPIANRRRATKTILPKRAKGVGADRY